MEISDKYSQFSGNLLAKLPRFSSPQPIPPKADPYATPVHRHINLLLLLISVAIIAILLLSGSHGQAANSPRPTAEKSTR